ncbi:MAG: GNAT family N-acetyltransferase [Capnocytophaga sp.]|nr:GNAT family N-acetyltransferase [Capnocytophaga sp.]
MIRFATPSDADFVAPLMFQAMEEIVCKLIGKENSEETIDFLKTLFRQENNQYSFQNTIVFEENQEIIGSLVFYDGKNLHQLRKPVLDLAFEKYQQTLQIEDETHAGETYIDTLSVLPKAQGKGVGSQLISFLIEYVTTKKLPPLGLLVDEKNPDAERLYTRLGFAYKNSQILAGGVYKHLVFSSL